MITLLPQTSQEGEKLEGSVKCDVKSDAEILIVQIRPHYLQYIELLNKQAELKGYSDAGEDWRMKVGDFHTLIYLCIKVSESFSFIN